MGLARFFTYVFGKADGQEKPTEEGPFSGFLTKLLSSIDIIKIKHIGVFNAMCFIYGHHYKLWK